MAFLIPDNLRSRKDVSENIRKVASAFASGLDDDATVWFEPLFDPSGERPHLVVLEPRLGALVLEVFNSSQKRTLLGGFRGKLRVEADGREEEVDDPLARAEHFAGMLRSRVAATTLAPRMRVTALAVFPGITAQQADEIGLGSIVPTERCVFQPDLDAAIQDGDGERLLRAFRRAGAALDGGELAPGEVDALRGLIHPEVVITQAQQGSLFSGATGAEHVVKVMDRKQEAFAKSLGSGHRVIRGVAGSGKTLILVHRARLLARLLPSKRILLTCYTKSLASQLKAQVAEYDNIEVVNIDKLMTQWIRDAKLKHPGYDGPVSVESVAVEAAAKASSPRYRAVLIDEAQDLDTDALKFCLAILESDAVDEQDVVIVADSAQNIFRRNFRWKDAGVQAQGRTRVLRVNYRNTRQIVEFASQFLLADGAISVDDEGDDGLSVVPAEACEREGPVPQVRVVDGVEDEIDGIVEQVRSWVAAGNSKSRSIAVLFGEDAKDRPTRVVGRLQAAGIDVFWVTDPQAKANKDLAGSAVETVIVSTIHSAKGLEFPRVVVGGLGVRDGDSTTGRKLAYVGFTRAVEELTVVVGRTSPFAADLEQLASV